MAWGLDADLKPLASERDQIFRVEVPDGRRFVLKLTNPAEAPLATDFQTRTLLHAAQRDPDLPIPRLVPTRDGQVAFRPDWPGEAAPTARLLSWLDGDLMALQRGGTAQARALGRFIARLGLALEDFDHPGARHDMPWDLRRAALVRPDLAAIESAPRRRLAEAAFDRFERETAPALERLPRQVIHADLTPYNVLVDPLQPRRITGVIDFGDAVRTARVCETAVAASYLMGEGPDALTEPAALVSAGQAERPLTVEELALIVPLMEARHAMTVAITEAHAARRPDNRAYITKNTATAWRGLATLADRSLDQWSSVLLAACRLKD